MVQAILRYQPPFDKLRASRPAFAEASSFALTGYGGRVGGQVPAAVRPRDRLGAGTLGAGMLGAGMLGTGSLTAGRLSSYPSGFLTKMPFLGSCAGDFVYSAVDPYQEGVME